MSAACGAREGKKAHYILAGATGPAERSLPRQQIERDVLPDSLGPERLDQSLNLNSDAHDRPTVSSPSSDSSAAPAFVRYRVESRIRPSVQSPSLATPRKPPPVSIAAPRSRARKSLKIIFMFAKPDPLQAILDYSVHQQLQTHEPQSASEQSHRASATCFPQRSRLACSRIIRCRCAAAA